MHPLRKKWSDNDLDVAILELCQEFPDAPMIAYSRALEGCRRLVRGGGQELLLDTMRLRLQEELSLRPHHEWRGDRTAA